MTFDQWQQRHPQAAADLSLITAQVGAATPEPALDESYAQQQARFVVSRAGGLVWRNNVGATPTKIPTTCPKCRNEYEIAQRPIRYGLANDSQQLNAVVKSSDLIGVMPRVVSQDMVGTTIGQFIAIECKRVGWRYTGRGREVQQQAFLARVLEKGGSAQFSTGGVKL